MTTATVSSLQSAPGLGRRKAKNNIATAVITGSFLLALIPLVWLLWTVISKGYSVIIQQGWFTEDQSGITNRRAGGGVLHAVIGTLQQVAVASIIAIPISIMVAIYLIEYGSNSRLATWASFMIDILTGIPSIVAALFIYAVFVTSFGGVQQGFYVSLALVMLMIPVVVRSTEEMLKLVPNELREASYALGVPKWKTIVRIVLPTALSGIVTGVMLGVARIAGETAPLLVLVGYSQTTNWDLFSGSQGSLPGMINDQAPNYTLPHPADRMWGAALTLILIVMGLNLLARFFTRFSKITN
ncbi:phosphate ABC transporter membrane protein 2 (PhoT family) [Jatrophihabitans sp. GAS493]|uniref:phosphate ABC transporter permease PstA n=1 Tax=Jatrophihabitans sp. GAS493 TaxID=1907575 RepID=UPI000BB6A0EB|nr:phosphate ABC transporter permease PstA [Jatrophihabitans sp. GAS493]SOD70748.1 phosphate ABC transporter membrane protein 2 (PhoT family) [Jatrophihabitans sp. GAS493]